jgi:AcrR family transcriptional regulator
MSGLQQLGRRERKKAATRASILNAARELFLEHGFDAVSVRDIADKADVSPTTVFAYFPQKESLAFGDEDERHERLVAAVVGRGPETSISEALQTHFRSEIAAFQSEPQRQVLALMEATPALGEYAERMWFRHEGALAAAISEEFGLTQPNDEIRLFVRFALQIQLVAIQGVSPEATIAAGFRFLDEGWTNYHRRAESARREPTG